MDLDGTLVAVFNTQSKVQHSTINVDYHKSKRLLYVVARRGLIRFLQILNEHYEIQLYTASKKDLAETILREFDADFYISKIFHRDHCWKMPNGTYLKALSSIGVDTSSCVLIDVDIHRYQKYSLIIIKG